MPRVARVAMRPARMLFAWITCGCCARTILRKAKIARKDDAAYFIRRSGRQVNRAERSRIETNGISR